MRRGHIQGLRFRLPGIRILELLFVAVVMALLTLITGDLPELEVVESTVNDDSFTDFVITTRGELPVDTNIVVLTYGPDFLNENQLIDRATLAQHLTLLFEMKPALVAVDYLVEETRPDYPDGDEMLAGLIKDHPDDLLIGIFREDSLNRFRTPPSFFGLSKSQLGCVNLMPGEDRTIRTFQRSWTAEDGEKYELLAVKAAQHINPEAAEHFASFDAESFIIDYAGGLGEHQAAEGENAVQVFPNFPLNAVLQAAFSDNPEDRAFFEETIAGKAVMVGYADLRQGQVASIVDRFYTPLKPEKNSLPDMHGVAVHANILNTILQRRVVFEVPGWVNVIWGTLIVFLMYYGYESLRTVRPPSKRALLMYPGFLILLAVGLVVPIFLFRYTPWKLSIYTPFAGMLLGPLVLGIYEKLKRISLDANYRRKLRRPTPEGLRTALLSILALTEPNERYVQGLHVLQRFFHTCCDRMFAEAMRRDDIGFSAETVASPTPSRIRQDMSKLDLTKFSQGSQDAAAMIEILVNNPLLRRSLRVARSLVIALNEINRQNAALDEEERLEEEQLEEVVQGADTQEESEYTDTVMAAVGGMVEANDYKQFEELYKALEEFVSKGRTILANNDGTFRTIAATAIVEESTVPFIVQKRCVVHNRDETFVYVSEQEDANNRDDYFDLLYAGDTLRCRPKEHPGLTEFRAEIQDSSVIAE